MKQLFLLLLISLNYTLFAQWDAPITVATNAGQYTSMAIVNGHPAISFYQQSGLDLYYIRASNPSGSSWNLVEEVRVGAHWEGKWNSLAIVDGRPAISYRRENPDDVMYIRADDINGEGWEAESVLVDGDGDSDGQYTSLVVVNGNPAICYYDIFNENGNLKYVRATNATGSSWGTPVTPAGGDPDDGRYTSMLIVNGNPAICHYRETGFPMFVRAIDEDGNQWGGNLYVDGNTNNAGQNTSMVVVNGNPAVCYRDLDDSSLKFNRAKDVNGADWSGSIETVDENDIGQTSMAIVDGFPAIAYYDATNDNLNYVRAKDANGTNWEDPIAVDGGAEDVGRYCSLVVVNGKPAISYWDETNDDLKYVRANTTTGYPDPLPVEMVDFWVSKRINEVLLRWQTASETNNKGFFVERSSDAFEWETLDFIAGQGTVTHPQDYQFIDNRPFSGTNYYRLKQLDLDGSFEYSDIKVVEITNSKQFSIFPNPVVGDEVHISFDSKNEVTEMVLQIQNLKGQIVQNHRIPIDSRKREITISTESLGSGVHFILCKIGNEIFTDKLIKVRS